MTLEVLKTEATWLECVCDSCGEKTTLPKTIAYYGEDRVCKACYCIDCILGVFDRLKTLESRVAQLEADQ